MTHSLIYFTLIIHFDMLNLDVLRDLSSYKILTINNIMHFNVNGKVEIRAANFIVT